MSLAQSPEQFLGTHGASVVQHFREVWPFQTPFNLSALCRSDGLLHEQPRVALGVPPKCGGANAQFVAGVNPLKNGARGAKPQQICAQSAHQLAKGPQGDGHPLAVCRIRSTGSAFCRDLLERGAFFA